MKKAILLLALGLGALIFLLVLRTLLHRPAAIEVQGGLDIELDESAIARHLSEAIQFQTISHQNPDQLESKEFDGFVQWVSQTYPELHASMELTIPGGYTMLYKWVGTNPALKPVLLTGHYDVVPVIPGSEGLWQHPPFAGEIVDGVIWGRGALDDKSGVIAQLEAASYLLRAGFKPERSIYFSFGHDEEVGGPNGAGKVAAFLATQGIQLAWSLDEGSFLFDGMLPGISELMAVVNVAEKGSVTLEVVAKAAGGHSSMPPTKTAVGLLADAIRALEENPIPGGLSGLSAQMFDTASRHMPFSNRLFFANQWLFGSLIEAQLEELPFGNAMLRTTTAPTMLSGSIKSNVLPIEAKAVVNFRIHPRDTVESVIEHVEKTVEGESIEVRVPSGGGRNASPVSSWETDGYQVIKTAVREIYGPVVVTPGLMIAGSDSRHYGKVADDAYRFNPMALSPDDMAGFHGTNEKISVANLLDGTRTYIRIITLGTQEQQTQD